MSIVKEKPMKTGQLIRLIAIIALLSAGLKTYGTTLYVDINSTNPVTPYTDWSTAAADIQQAVDAAGAGDTILITNGTYLLNNEITITNAITLESVNGPELTIVDGGGSNRCFNLQSNPCRLEGLTIQNGGNSSVNLGGGVLCQNDTTIITNCIFQNNYAEYGGGLARGRAENCRFIGNTADGGAGLYRGNANYCLFKENKASIGGGGIYYGTANHCSFQKNEAVGCGGGMHGGTATYCIFETNMVTTGYGIASFYGGGGMSNGEATNCVFIGNTADQTYGGGASCSTVINCAFIGNSALNGGGIAAYVSHYDADGPSKAVNCTFFGNTAGANGGGIYWTESINSIVWDNTAVNDGENIWQPHKYNYDYAVYSTEVRYTCSPDTVHGVDGNITNAPLIISDAHLASNSPCIGAGTNLFYGTDIDDEPWNNPPSMGCDEPAGNTDRPILLYITGISERVLVDYEMELSLTILGPCSGFCLDFGDGSTYRICTATNYTVLSHHWEQTGPHSIVLTGYDSCSCNSVSITQQIEVVSAETAAIYVAPGGNDADPGTNWSIAKATIQAGVDAQLVPGGTVWVTNGTYLQTKRISIETPVVVQGVHGAEFTMIDGGQSNRCFNLNNSKCVLRDLTIANGFVDNDEGGGIYCDDLTPVVESCVILSNKASSGGGMYQGTANNCVFKNNKAYYGGGMYEGTAIGCLFEENASTSGLLRGGGGTAYGTASNCVFLGNTSTAGGGGTFHSIVANSVFIRNSAKNGGGMLSHSSTSYYGVPLSYAIHCTFLENNASAAGGGIYVTPATNCIVWNNTAAESGDNLKNFANVAFSCSPDLTHGENGNITNAPAFVDAAAGNYRLQSNSPCINWGSDAYVSIDTDLDGNPRIVGTQVDMGAYEYQIDLGDDVDGDGVSDEWEQIWFGYNVLPTDNADGDVFSNGDEYIAGTDPTRSSSLFAVTNTLHAAEGFVIEWNAVEGRTYSMHWSDALTNSYQPIATNMVYPQNSFTDTVHHAEEASFYQVHVELSE
jgi:parallel beta-helix repeat protein